jgi:zinc protease
VSGDAALGQRVLDGLAALPEKGAPAAALPPLDSARDARKGPRVLVVEKDTDSTAFSLGYPYDLKRGDADWPAMVLATSAFGEHRQFVGRLMIRLRERRGLNYGDYAYAEHFEQAGDSTFALTGIGRSQQLFSIWLRPVEPHQAAFALRAALYETKLLVEKGLDAAELERAKSFLDGYTRLWDQTALRRVGYALDERFYGTPGYLANLRARLATLTLDEVNAAIRKWIVPDKLRVAIVTRDGAALVKQLTSDAPTPITYTAEKPAELVAEDKTIAAFPLGLKAADVKVVKASELFER